MLLDQESLEGDWLKSQLKQVEKTEDLQEWLLNGKLSHPMHFPFSINGQEKKTCNFY
ncbi:MAG: hypothetical protein ACKO4S_14175 [Snowella sp.]